MTGIEENNSGMFIMLMFHVVGTSTSVYVARWPTLNF